MGKRYLSKIYKPGESNSVEPITFMSVTPNDLDESLLVEKKAYARGFESGEKAGFGLGQERVNKLIDRFESILEELIAFKDNYYSDKEEELAGLAVTIAKKVVHSELSVNKGVVKNVVKAAINAMTKTEGMTLRLNPEDLEYLIGNHPEFLKKLSDIKGFSVDGDIAVGGGGCLVASKHAEVDARIEEEFKVVENAMKEALGK